MTPQELFANFAEEEPPRAPGTPDSVQSSGHTHAVAGAAGATPDDDAISLTAAGRLAAKTRQTIANWVDEGRLEAIPVGRRRFVSRRAVLALLARPHGDDESERANALFRAKRGESVAQLAEIAATLAEVRRDTRAMKALLLTRGLST